MKDNFNACLALTLRHEGGYVNHPRDPGGPTNLGITIATLSHELGRKATIADVRALSCEQAGAIYRKKYWKLVGGDDLPRGVDALLFDIAVNSGPARALDMDKFSNALEPLARIRALDARRRSFYRGLQTFGVFGRGWMARENDIFRNALAMAAGVTSGAPAPTEPRRKQEGNSKMFTLKGYRTYLAAGIVATGGLIAQTDWIAFMQNPKAGLVAFASGALMAIMRSITTSAPGAIR